MYEHPPVTENCMICHNPHGTVAKELLKQSPTFLCLRVIRGITEPTMCILGRFRVTRRPSTRIACNATSRFTAATCPESDGTARFSSDNRANQRNPATSSTGFLQTPTRRGGPAVRPESFLFIPSATYQCGITGRSHRPLPLENCRTF